MGKPCKQTLPNSFVVYARSAAYLEKHKNKADDGRTGVCVCGGLDGQVGIARPWKDDGMDGWRRMDCRERMEGMASGGGSDSAGWNSAGLVVGQWGQLTFSFVHMRKLTNRWDEVEESHCPSRKCLRSGLLWRMWSTPVIVSFSCQPTANLESSGKRKRKLQLKNCFDQIGLWPCLCQSVFTDDCCGRAHPIVGNTTLMQLLTTPGLYKKVI